MVFLTTEEPNSFRRYLEGAVAAAENMPMISGYFKFRLGGSTVVRKNGSADAIRYEFDQTIVVLNATRGTKAKFVTPTACQFALEHFIGLDANSSGIREIHLTDVDERNTNGRFSVHRAILDSRSVNAELARFVLWQRPRSQNVVLKVRLNLNGCASQTKY